MAHLCASNCSVCMGHGVAGARKEDSGMGIVHVLEAQLRCLHFTWETVRSIGSLPMLGAYDLWAGTEPRSARVHGAGPEGPPWFMNPQGCDFKSSSLESEWKGKLAH